jgi:hypothetical protein
MSGIAVTQNRGWLERKQLSDEQSGVESKEKQYENVRCKEKQSWELC